ncbi:hypothetical protein BESB_079640 [Besnoitia besnoiti]|uniref:Adaptor complexes medium subunit family protein n=1 Tax=Besnoitia besnoiti TaxID=94643 RepID=A0A2A9M5J4_BESBE|nr:hypothetical protein BESB_079640 [Besnoitia besnoiti]PFH33748.1 hypothetical protein BESB_079640 [Besnoitia besnoiti]
MCSVRGWWLLEVTRDASPSLFSAPDVDFDHGFAETGDSGAGALWSGRFRPPDAARPMGSKAFRECGTASATAGGKKHHEADNGNDLLTVRVALSRRYPTVDERWRKLAGPAYVPLPSDETLRQAFVAQLLEEPKDDAWRCCACCSPAPGGGEACLSLTSPSTAASSYGGCSPQRLSFAESDGRRRVDSGFAAGFAAGKAGEERLVEQNSSFYYDLYQETHFEELTWPCGPTAMLVLPPCASSALHNRHIGARIGPGHVPFQQRGSGAAPACHSPTRRCRQEPSDDPNFGAACERGPALPPVCGRYGGFQSRPQFSLSGEDGARGVCSLTYPSAAECLEGRPSPCSRPGASPSPPSGSSASLPLNSTLFSLLWPVVFVRKEMALSRLQAGASLLAAGAKKQDEGGGRGSAAHASAFSEDDAAPVALQRLTSAGAAQPTAAGSAGKGKKGGNPSEGNSSLRSTLVEAKPGRGERVLVALAALAVDDALGVDSLHPATARCFDLPQVTAAFHVLDQLMDLYLSMSPGSLSPPSLLPDAAVASLAGRSLASRLSSSSRASSSMNSAPAPLLNGVAAHRETPRGPEARGEAAGGGDMDAESGGPASLPFLMALQLALPFGRPKLTCPRLLKHAYDSVASLPDAYSFLPPSHLGGDMSTRSAEGRTVFRESLEGDRADSSSQRASEDEGRQQRRSARRRNRAEERQDPTLPSFLPPRPPGPRGPSQSLAQLRETKVKQYLGSLSSELSTVSPSSVSAASTDLRALQLRRWRSELAAKKSSFSSAASPGPGASPDFFEATLGSTVCLDFEDSGSFSTMSEFSFSDVSPPVDAPHSRTLHRRLFDHALWRRRPNAASSLSDRAGALGGVSGCSTACTSAFTPSGGGAVWSVPAWLPLLSPSGWTDGFPVEEGSEDEGDSLRSLEGSASRGASPRRASRGWWWPAGSTKKERVRGSQTPDALGGETRRRGGRSCRSSSSEGRGSRDKPRGRLAHSTRSASLRFGEGGSRARGSSWGDGRGRGDSRGQEDSGAMTDVERRSRGRLKERLRRRDGDGSRSLSRPHRVGEAFRSRHRVLSANPKNAASRFSLLSAFGRVTGLMSGGDGDGDGRAPGWKWLTRTSWIRFALVEKIHCTMHEPRAGVEGPEATAPDECSIVGDLHVTACLRKMMEVSVPVTFSRTASLPDVYVHPTARLSNSPVDLLNCASSGGGSEKKARPGGDRESVSASLMGQQASQASLPPLLVSCVPPLGLQSYLLCEYRFGCLPFYPLKALYQVKEIQPCVLRLLLQLQFHPALLGRLSSCALWLPFGHKGLIEYHDLKASQGAFRISADKRAVLWTLPKHIKRSGLVGAASSATKESGVSTLAGSDSPTPPGGGSPQVSLLGELVLAPLPGGAASGAADPLSGPSGAGAAGLSPRRQRRSRQRAPAGDPSQTGGEDHFSGLSCLARVSGGNAFPSAESDAPTSSSFAVGALGAGETPASWLSDANGSLPRQAQTLRERLFAAAGDEERLPLSVRRFLADEAERVEDEEACRLEQRREGEFSASSVSTQLAAPGPRGSERAGVGTAAGDWRENACGLSHAHASRQTQGGSGDSEPPRGSRHHGSLPVPSEQQPRAGQRPHVWGSAAKPGWSEGGQRATPSDLVEGVSPALQARSRPDGAAGGRGAPSSGKADAPPIAQGLAPPGPSLAPSVVSGSPRRPHSAAVGPASGARDGPSSCRDPAPAKQSGVGDPRGCGGGSAAAAVVHDCERPESSACAETATGTGRMYGGTQTKPGASAARSAAPARRGRGVGAGLLTDREELILRKGVNNFLALIQFEAKGITLSGSDIDKEAVTMYPHEHLEVVPPLQRRLGGGDKPGGSKVPSFSAAACSGLSGKNDKWESFKGVPGWAFGAGGGKDEDAGCSISVLKRTVAGRYIVWNALGDNRASKVHLSFGGDTDEEENGRSCGSTHASGASADPVARSISAASAVSSRAPAAGALRLASTVKDTSAATRDGNDAGQAASDSACVFEGPTDPAADSRSPEELRAVASKLPVDAARDLAYCEGGAPRQGGETDCHLPLASAALDGV